MDIFHRTLRILFETELLQVNFSYSQKRKKRTIKQKKDFRDSKLKGPLSVWHVRRSKLFHGEGDETRSEESRGKVKARAIASALPFTHLLMRGVYSPSSGLWTWSCDLLWPMEWGRSD